MAKVEITVNGRAYTIGCEDGHEQRLMRLAERFDAEVTKLAERVGQIGDLRLFLMAGLVVSDALDEAEAGARQPVNGDGRAAALIAEAAERIEALAARAEKAGSEPAN